MKSTTPLYSGSCMQAPSMAIPTLPSEIITDILSRLPSKTLIRFKSVSKQWYSLINSPNFINLHLSQTLISDDNSHNLVLSLFSLFSSPISDNHTNPNFHFSELDHPLKQVRHLPYIFGSINGVLCISLCDKSSIFLYNPSTKTHHLVPPFTPSANTNPDFEITHGNICVNVVVIGFGFDSLREDYKVVRMTETYKNSVLVYREASVYSLRNDSWKCVSDQTTMGQYILPSSVVVCVNDGLHFIVVDDTKSNYKFKVKCFNLQTEKFSIFELPELEDKFSKVSCVMRELGGCFSVLVNYVNMIGGRTGALELVRLDLWVMKEYGNTESWFRLFSNCDLTIFPLCGHMRQLVFSKDKQRVLLELNLSLFGWYSWGSNTFERITLHGFPYANAVFDSWTYLDSLVSLS